MAASATHMLVVLALLSLATSFTWPRFAPCHHRPTAVFSTAAPAEQAGAQIERQVYECKGCKETYNSRNALFRHLRGEDEASAACSVSMDNIATAEVELLMTAAVRYGYHDGEDRSATNDVVANKIHRAFVDAAQRYNFTVATTALTYSTAAKLRRPSLRQDAEVTSATSEVMSFNYRLARNHTAISKWKDYSSSGELLGQIQALLDDAESQLQIRLHAMDALVARSTKLYAERSCTQSSYRFLLPLKWILPDTAESELQVKEWWRHISPSINSHREHQPRSEGIAPETPNCIKRLKQSLKAAESQTVPNRRLRREAERNNITGTPNEVDAQFKLAPGRFGQLWRKSRRCWSNFASPESRGLSSSPAHEAVWRTMDRAKIVGFLDAHDDEICDETDVGDIHIVLEFRADGFLFGQLPRIVSALVGVTNGWLPPNFFETATRPDVYMRGLPAPPVLGSRLYFWRARYHFHELTGNRGSLWREAQEGQEAQHNGGSFERTIYPGSQSEEAWEAELHTKLLRRAVSSIDDAKDDDWLVELRDVISPALRRQIETVEADDATDNSPSSDADESTLPLVDTDAPKEYATVLDSLRGVVKDGKWPATSDARSRVIKTVGATPKNALATRKRVTASAFPGNVISSGSFTVVNEELWGKNELPKANSLFPDLAKAIFALEEDIIRQASPHLPAADGMGRSDLRRMPSTHCAVNRNAQFTPHVDSGRGLGQSVSMIVGLGNYTGGETLVENKKYYIRYNPLEFDGWNQLHWTAPFTGERYSLVWFTPELSRSTEEAQQSEERGARASKEDLRASRLAKEHSKRVPFLPPLQYRKDSTDSLVIAELLDTESGCAYDMKPNAEMPSGFSLENHTAVLDIGAHIGVFSRYALAKGCQRIIAYEPEPSNYELLSENLRILSQQSAATNQLTVELHQTAAAQETAESRILVKARNENSGKKNTWRHSLEDYSHYVDRQTKLPSKLQQATLERVPVPCISFFRKDRENGALVPGVTFVKLDCEGAEIEILLSEDASQSSSWLDVTHLAFEWSFTKERRVDVFHRAMGNLRDAGFKVHYEGAESWWDRDGVLWPYPTDLIVFAVRDE